MCIYFTVTILTTTKIIGPTSTYFSIGMTFNFGLGKTWTEVLVLLVTLYVILDVNFSEICFHFVKWE